MSFYRKSARLNSNSNLNERSPLGYSLSPKQQQNQSKNGIEPYKRNTRQSNASINDTSDAERSTLKQIDSQSLMNPQQQNNQDQMSKCGQGKGKIEVKQETSSESSMTTLENEHQKELEFCKNEKSSLQSLSESDQHDQQAEDEVFLIEEDGSENDLSKGRGDAEALENAETDKSVSATKKAVNKLENNMKEHSKLKKKSKVSLLVRRKRLNKKLLKIMSPNPGTTLLTKLAPECIFKTRENPSKTPDGSTQFEMEVEYEGEVIGKAEGTSLSQCKEIAAEKAIKEIVSRKIVDDLKEKTAEGMKVERSDGSGSSIPWTGLASFALYKLFNEWQIQNLDLSFFQSMAENASENPAEQPKISKELPPNAAELHPCTLLCIMKPGITAVELDRTLGPNPQVTMGYKIDDQMFKGTGSNKKNARKEAAKSANTALWGVEYL